MNTARYLLSCVSAAEAQLSCADEVDAYLVRYGYTRFTRFSKEGSGIMMATRIASPCFGRVLLCADYSSYAGYGSVRLTLRSPSGAQLGCEVTLSLPVAGEVLLSVLYTLGEAARTCSSYIELDSETQRIRDQAAYADTEIMFPLDLSLCATP